jgi:hypothetical protein
MNIRPVEPGTAQTVFRDPQPQLAGVLASKSENPAGTLNQELDGTASPRKGYGSRGVDS